MGKSMFCDVCRNPVSIEEALKEVKIGELVVCEVCLTCGSQLEQSLKKQIATNVASLMAAQKAAIEPPKEVVTQPNTEPKTMTEAEIKAKISGGDKNAGA